MGLYDEQIKQRKRNDEKRFSDSFADLASVIMGEKAAAKTLNEQEKATNAIGEILKFFHAPAGELPAHPGGIDDQIEYLCRPSGIMRRTVELTDGWYRNASGPYLGFLEDGSPVALIPHGNAGYRYFDWGEQRTVDVDAASAQRLQREAICFYRPLPLRELGVADLARFALDSFTPADYAMILVATGASTLLGFVTPVITQFLYGTVIPVGASAALMSTLVLLVGMVLSSSLINIVRSAVLARMQTRLSVSIEAAVMARVLSLPASFFKRYGSGDLASRVQGVRQVCTVLSDMVLTVGLSSVFSLAYLVQAIGFAPQLVLPSLFVTLVNIAIVVVSGLVKASFARRQLQYSAKNSSVVLALIGGIQKIRLAGAERRAFAHWADGYRKQASCQYGLPRVAVVGPALTAAITLAGNIVIYHVAATAGIAVADYMAFSSSYGMVSGGVAQLASLALVVAQIQPLLEMVEPVLKEVPEVSEGKRVVTRLSGSIELSRVSFRYTEGGPDIIHNLSLRIRPGQYVAVVGETGCGKSTLMRLMLGFEKPRKGAIYFDGRDIDKIDLRSLRRHIGVVMQDGKLFQGDIFSNIVISAPQLTLDDAWEAAEMAGIADDIRAMPMGMHTIISEGSGGISGGQRQRLMIARAIAPKPKILFFDEATSALDNVTQKIVSDSLDSLRSTRVVIAHRLSTIRHCDRILVMRQGGIVADGTYDELLETCPYFADLVSRQRVEA